MKQILLSFLVFFISSHSYTQSNQLGKEIIPFSMQVVNGPNISISDWSNYQGIALVFVCNHCPMAKLYWKRMQEMFERNQGRKILVVAVNPMDSLLYEEETRSKMQLKVKKEKITLPYVQDGDQSISQSFEIPHTPHCILLWKDNKHWFVRYEGAFDNNGLHPDEAEPYLQNAINQLYSGENPTLPVTESFGCRVFYRKE